LDTLALLWREADANRAITAAARLLGRPLRLASHGRDDVPGVIQDRVDQLPLNWRTLRPSRPRIAFETRLSEPVDFREQLLPSVSAAVDDQHAVPRVSECADCSRDGLYVLLAIELDDVEVVPVAVLTRRTALRVD